MLAHSTHLHHAMVCAALLACALAAAPASAQTGSKAFVAHEMRAEGDDRQLASAPVMLQHPEYVKPRLRIAGMILTLTGVLGGVTAFGLFLYSAGMDCEGAESCGMEVGFASIGVALVSTPFLLFGIPMWIAGSRRVAPAGAARLLPRALSLGPTSASARWEF